MADICVHLYAFIRARAHTHTHTLIKISSPFFVHPQCVCVPSFCFYHHFYLPTYLVSVSAEPACPQTSSPALVTRQLNQCQSRSTPIASPVGACMLWRVAAFSPLACALSCSCRLRIADAFQRNTRPSATRWFTNDCGPRLPPAQPAGSHLPGATARGSRASFRRLAAGDTRLNMMIMMAVGM